jgi:ATP synthase protein I
MKSKDARDGRDRVAPNETAWMITARLIAGIAIYGGVGWLLGQWLGHESLFIAGGGLFGMAAGLWLVYFKLQHETNEPSLK